jgi:hypothetical protein
MATSLSVDALRGKATHLWPEKNLRKTANRREWSEDPLNFSESGWWGRILSGNESADSNSDRFLSVSDARNL